MNRRNVLIGLGAVAAGGGAVLGSGAFSQVEADRTMTVSFSDDDTAELSLNPDSSYARTVSGTNSANILRLEFSNLNDDATSTFNGVFTVANNDSDGNTHTVYIDSTQSSSEIDGSVIDFQDSSGNSIIDATSGTNLVDMTTGDAAEPITVVIDATNAISSSLNVTLVAE